MRSTPLLRRLVLVRCDVADGVADERSRETLDEVMDHLADRDRRWLDPDVQTWAVLTAEAMRRPDLVALIFAAAVRGLRPEARERWDEWSSRVLLVPLVLPPDPGPGGPGGPARAAGHLSRRPHRNACHATAP